MPPVAYKIEKHLATLSDNFDGTKEFNIVRWGGNASKYDLRRWRSDGTPGKGITLCEDELAVLASTILSEIKEGPSIQQDKYDWLEETLEDSSWLQTVDFGWYKIIPEKIGIQSEFESLLEIVEIDDIYKLNIDVVFSICADDEIYGLYLISEINRLALEKGIMLHAYNDDMGTDEGFNVTIAGVFLAEDEERFLYRLESFYNIMCELSTRINELLPPETKQVEMNNFLVIGDRMACFHEMHFVESIIAVIDFCDKNGDITKVEVPAGYCPKCNLFFIRRYDYECTKDKVSKLKMLCQVIEEKVYLQNPKRVEWSLNDESVYHKLGYNLSEGLSERQRREILRMIIEKGIRTKEQTLAFLAELVRRNKPRENMKHAIQTWESDREYILKHDQTNRGRDVRPKIIKVIKFKG